MPLENEIMTPRATVLRMLRHMENDVTYEDIIRQIRILQRIEWTTWEVDLAGVPGDGVADELDLQADGSGEGGRTVAVDTGPLPGGAFFSWQSLAEQPEDHPAFAKAAWIY
jgi:hypothetical protein